MIKKAVLCIKYTMDVLKVLWRSDKYYIVMIICDILISAGQPFIDMYLVKYSIDMLVNGVQLRDYICTILTIILTKLGLAILQAYFNYKRDVCGNLIGIKMYEEVYCKTMTLDYEMLMNKEIMELREFALKVIDGMHITLFSQGFKIICSNLIILVGIISLLTSMDMWVILVSFIMILINSAALSYRKNAERKMDDDFVSINRKVDYFFDIGADFTYSKELRIYQMLDPMLKVYRRLTDETKKLVQKLLRMALVCKNVSYSLSGLLDILMYISLGYKVLVSRKISVGDFSLYLNTIRTFNSSVTSIVTSYIDIENHGKYIQKYLEYINMTTIQAKQRKKIELPSEYIFQFENVSYKYPHQKKYALRNVNLTIRDGEKIAVVGENGAGKTTLILLLMGMIVPTNGRILLNGVDIQEYESNEYMKIFSTVFQDFKLFSFTVRDNVSSLDTSDDADIRINYAIMRVGLDDKVKSLKKGIYTFINQIFDTDGISFSGGETQRLAMARALYKNAPIIILDEPTSALDPRMEYDIYVKFDEISNNKTTIYITHRLASTQFCDRVIVLKDGSIHAIGTHHELLTNNNYYHEMYDMQAKFYKDTVD